MVIVLDSFFLWFSASRVETHEIIQEAVVLFLQYLEGKYFKCLPPHFKTLGIYKFSYFIAHSPNILHSFMPDYYYCCCYYYYYYYYYYCG